MGYHVDTGREKVVNDLSGGPNRYGWGWPWYRRSYFYGFHDPFFDNDVSSYTVYTSELDLDIEQTATGERVFEGTARAQSRTDRLQRIVPNLVEAMFTGFPGNSGETVKKSEEHTSELQSLMRISYAVFCLKKKNKTI